MSDHGGYVMTGEYADEFTVYLRDPAAYAEKQRRRSRWHRRLGRWLDRQQLRARWWVSNAILARSD